MKTHSIKICGKSVISTYNHFIMSLTYDKISNPSNILSMECVTKYPKKMINGTYTTTVAKQILKENKGKCDVFIFHDKSGNVVGTLSVMYKGGNEVEYKIRNIDAFIYNVLTDSRYRGKGYAGEMIRLLMEYLHKKSIDKAYLAVSTNNKPAVRAYKKTGFIKENDSTFIRLLKINIPYRVL